MNNRSKIYRQVRKKTRPLVNPLLRVAYTKVGGKHIFINKYSKSVPGVNKFVTKVEQRALIGHTKNERQIEYRKWFKSNYPSKDTLKKQKTAITKFKYQPLISVLIPTYNTEIHHLRDCLDSVLAQSYSNWELCIADDASPNKQIVEVLKEYAAKDKRIKYTIREKNGHICRATNSATKAS